MSILKNILKSFVEFKEEPVEGGARENRTETSIDRSLQDQDVNDAKPTVSASVAATPQTQATPTASTANPGEYQKHFEDLIQDANAKNPLFEGTDLKEFLDSKVDVEAIADEGTRYKTAFNVLKRTGLTKEKLVSTGQAYINLIENDLKGFETAYTQKYKSDVEQMEQVLQQKVAELKTLNDKITSLNQEIKQISENVSQSKDRLNANKIAFVSAGENKKKELQAELAKINQYFL